VHDDSANKLIISNGMTGSQLDLNARMLAMRCLGFVLVLRVDDLVLVLRVSVVA